MCVPTHTDTHQSVKPRVPHTQQHMCTAHKHKTLPNVTVRVSAGRQSACIRKVLRPAKSNKIFLGFSQSYSKLSVGAQNPHCSPPQNTALPTLSLTSPSEHKTSPTATLFPLLHIPTLHFPALYLRHLPMLYLATSLPLPEGRAGTACEPSEQQTPLTPRFAPSPHVIVLSLVPVTAPVSSSLSLSLYLYLFQG